MPRSLMSVFKQHVVLILALVGAIWTVSIVGFLVESVVRALALVPREISHLVGIVSMPFLHQDFAHLLANTLPLIAFSALLLTRGAEYFFSALAAVTLGSGVLLWLFGRSAAHIGASGVVFGLFGLLVARAIFTRSLESILIAIVGMLGYGGILWGVLPTDSAVSWEGHLAGLVAGVVTAKFLNAANPGST